jgi:hypothetical protein
VYEMPTFRPSGFADLPAFCGQKRFGSFETEFCNGAGSNTQARDDAHFSTILRLKFETLRTLIPGAPAVVSKLTLYETPGDAGPGRGFFPINPLVGSLTETTPFR